MAYAQITTVTSCDFAHNFGAAKRFVDEGGHVIITKRGVPSLALIPIDDYRRFRKADRSMVELLRMPEADAFDQDFESVSINAKVVDT